MHPHARPVPAWVYARLSRMGRTCTWAEIRKKKAKIGHPYFNQKFWQLIDSDRDRTTALRSKKRGTEGLRTLPMFGEAKKEIWWPCLVENQEENHNKNISKMVVISHDFPMVESIGLMRLLYTVS